MFKHIAVFGAGVMGYGLTLDFARYAPEVWMIDVNESALQKGMANIEISFKVLSEEGLISLEDVQRIRKNIHTSTNPKDALDDVDIVIEALPEVLSIKHDVLSQLDVLAPEKAIFISNSSSLRLSDVCSVLTPERRRRSLMAHYFNPPEIMPLVELLSLPETDETIMTDIRAFYTKIGKVPVRINKEVSGLSANRIQMAVWREMFWQLENGVINKEDMDKVLTYGPALRWATTGVITMLDMTGLDIVYNISNNLMPELDNSTQAAPLIGQLNEEHHFGLKTGQGFFDYPEETRAKVKEAYVRRLANQLALSNVNVSTGGT